MRAGVRETKIGSSTWNIRSAPWKAHYCKKEASIFRDIFNIVGILNEIDKNSLNCGIDQLFDVLKFMTNAFNKCIWDNNNQLYKDFILDKDNPDSI